MIASNQARFVGVRVVLEAVVIPDVAVALDRPYLRPRAYISVGRDVIQHSATTATESGILAAEHEHGDAVLLKASALRVEDDGVLTVHGQLCPYQQHLKGEHPYRPQQQHRLHSPPLLFHALG